MTISQKSNIDILKQLTKIAHSIPDSIAERSAENIEEKRRRSYLLSYPYFVNYFKNLESINLENIIIGISFTYSWMPTILKIDLEKSEAIIEILNEVKNGTLIDENQLAILETAFNNSLVGTSKLLHFINPNQYAIWDSNVFRFLYNEKPHKYKFAIYFEYLKIIESLKVEESFQTFYSLMKQKVRYDITEYRALELAFFEAGKL